MIDDMCINHEARDTKAEPGRLQSGGFKENLQSQGEEGRGEGGGAASKLPKGSVSR